MGLASTKEDIESTQLGSRETFDPMLMQADWPRLGREAFRTRDDDANTIAQACNAQHTQRHAGAVGV